jgi:hypothetical protein
MVEQGDVQPKGPHQRELLENSGCLLPFSKSSMEMSKCER